MASTDQQDNAPRIHRARYLLAMGITPWVPRGIAAPAVESAAAAQSGAQNSEPQSQRSQASYRLTVRLELAGESPFSWTEPPGRLLRSILAAVGVDPRLVHFADGQQGLPQLPLWQFGGDPGESCTLHLPSLEDMLATPALKASAWQMLSQQELG